MYYGYYGNMFGWSPFGGILSVIIWIIIVAVIIGIIRSILWGGRWNSRWDRGYRWGNNRWRSSNSSGALDVLNERYAKGEITKEEYEAKKKDILS